MRPTANMATGFVGGVSSGLELLDRLDARKRRQELQKRDDMLFDQSQQDRMQGLEDAETQRARQEQQFQQQQEELEYQRERRKINDEHQDAMLPLERQAAQTRLATAQTQQRIAKQKIKSQEAMSIWNQASVLFEGQEFEAAEAKIAELANYGYDVEDITTGNAQEASDYVEKFLMGELEYNSPEVKQLAKWVLTPSLVQSGRDPERFEIAGIMPTGKTDQNGDPTFAVSMNDKSDGTVKPVTLNMTNAEDDPDSKDPILEISAKDLMAATSGYISASQAGSEVHLRAIGQSFATEAYRRQTMSPAQTKEDEKLQAEIDKIKAQTDQIRSETSGAATSGSGSNQALQNLFLNTYDGDPRMQNIAKLLQESEGFNFETGIKTMSEIKAMANEKKYRKANLGAGELYQVYAERKSIEREVINLTGEKTSNFINQYPDLKESDKKYISDRISKAVLQFKDGKITEVQFSGKIKELHDRYQSKSAAGNRERARAGTLPEAQPVQQGPGLIR